MAGEILSWCLQQKQNGIKGTGQRKKETKTAMPSVNIKWKERHVLKIFLKDKKRF